MKIAVIVSGWHFPLHLYRALAAQKLPDGWSHDLFCVSHRDPKYSADEKRELMQKLGWSMREMYDRLLYAEFATEESIRAAGFDYKLYPNTIGDMGNVNQWLETHNYKDYDMLLISHDDNVILNDRLYTDLLQGELPWLILTNSKGSPLSWRELWQHWNKPITVRGSFEFVKPELIERIGGKFDLSEIALTREGETAADQNINTIRDWNKTVRPLTDFFEREGLKDKIVPLSPYYRVSKYCLEGERGFMHMTQDAFRANEDRGLAMVQKLYDAALASSKE